MVQCVRGKLSAAGRSIAIVVSRYNEEITTKLRDGAVEALVRHGGTRERIVEFSVPGAFELGQTARALAETRQFDAIICLGAVIRGETTHHEHVGGQAARMIAQLAYDTGVPIGFGVLTCDTDEQAMERAGGSEGNKGAEAAETALEMIDLLAQIRQGPRPS